MSELSPDEEVVTAEKIDTYGLSEYMAAAQGMPESFKIKILLKRSKVKIQRSNLSSAGQRKAWGLMGMRLRGRQPLRRKLCLKNYVK